MPLQEAAIMAGYSKTETTMMYCLVDQESVQHHYKKVFERIKQVVKDFTYIRQRSDVFIVH